MNKCLLANRNIIFAVSSSSDVHGNENAEADYDKFRRSGCFGE